MAGRNGQKVKLLRIIDILKQYTDEENPLSATEICNYLARYNITAERKAIYDDIAVLTDYGYDIVYTRTPQAGYFLASREFELPEIYLLGDAVRSARFISAKKTRELLAKLDTMLSNGQLRKREKGIYFDSLAKCENEEIFYNIDAISTAIEQNKKIVFQYTTRQLADNRTITTQMRQRTISPYALTWQDDHYYLIGNYNKYDNLIHLRVDRMRKVHILEEAVRPFSEVSEYRDYFDVSDYTKKLFSMHGGEKVKIELRCANSILEQVVDRFTDKIFIKNTTDSHFCFGAEAALSEALVTFIMNYGAQIEVLAPQELREMVIRRAQSILEVYQKG